MSDDVDREPLFSETEATVCWCGRRVPPISEWEGQPFPWPRWQCGCGREFVDEDEFVAVYPTHEETDHE